MKLFRLAFAALALSLGAPVLLTAQNWQGQNHPDHDRGGWDAPPREFRDIQRQGFHDGIEAAHNDFNNHYPPNIEQRREFRHPPVRGEFQNDYRDGFRRGYNMAFSHYRESFAPPPPPPHPGVGAQILGMVEQGMAQDRGAWDAPPQELREIQRQGFHDGLDAGHKDFDRRLPPNTDAWRTFRHPPVPRQFQDDYRDGFRRGYNLAFSHFREDHDRH
jgi:hypothetical protein